MFAFATISLPLLEIEIKIFYIDCIFRFDYAQIAEHGCPSCVESLR